MRKVQLLMPVAFAFIACPLFAQVSATATATAAIVAPINIVKTQDLNFGIIAQSTVVGWVQLSPSGTRTTTGGAVLLAQTGTVTPATFTVTGEGAYTYSITLPSTIVMTNTTGTGAETMTVENFLSSPDVSVGGALVAGTQTLTVGAELAVSADQVSGVYISGTPFSVTVNYN